MQHIAQNHGFAAATDYEESGDLCIYGGCNVPTLSDVQMLCEDVGIPSDCIESSEYGIDVWLTCEWFEEQGEKEYIPTGMEMWKRYGSAIGS